MKGQILDFSIQTNTGYISGDDGKRYHFSGQEWKDNKAPVKGGKVDFDISPSGEAIQIYVIVGQGIEGLAQNIDQQFNLWYWLMSSAPKGYIAPVACIFAACAYESGESDLAHKALDNAFADQISYPLAVLLRRVFFSGWPAQSFAAMRSELHPKICASLFGGSI